MRFNYNQRILSIAGVLPVVILWLAVLSCSTLQTQAGFEPTSDMPAVSEPDESKLIIGVVRNVLDGDTVEVFHDGRVVQYELAGADAPDIIENQERQLPGSGEAREYLISVLDGEQVGLYIDPKNRSDIRGRPLAYLYRMPDQLFVNLELVRLGHAKHARDPGGWNNAVLLWAQGRAKEAKKGVWDPDRKRMLLPQVNPVEPDQKKVEAKIEPAAEVAADDEPPAEHAPSETVYITKSGSKYHTKDCQHVGESAIEKPRSSITGTHKPCKVCKPDGAGAD